MEVKKKRNGNITCLHEEAINSIMGLDQGILTFKAKMRCNKGEAVDEVYKILCSNY